MAELRPTHPDDTVLLHQNCWPEKSLAEIEAFLARQFAQAQRKRAYLLTALLNDQPIAFGLLRQIGKTVEISDLIVAEAQRGKGIGTAIIQHLMEKAYQFGFDRVEIGVAEHNHRAFALYTRLGFVPFRVLHLDEPTTYLARSLP